MNTKIFPGIFVSHGAPTLAIEEGETPRFLRRLGADMGRPRAILRVSAHRTTRVPTASASPQPETIHDFGGFPEALYKMRHDAPGSASAVGQGTRAESLHRGWTYVSPSMAAYRF